MGNQKSNGLHIIPLLSQDDLKKCLRDRHSLVSY